MDVSVVIPVMNEFENLPILHRELSETFAPLGLDYELLFVDDGSTDGTTERLNEIAKEDPHVTIIEFRRNFGQTAAMQAGIQTARGDVMITMDGDLQNDPADIPMMLAEIEDGYDLIHGWRKERQDAFLNRKLPSRIANWLISKSTGFPIHDLGCTLKAIRRDVARELELYGEMHRFIPILAHKRGARCKEVVTHHRARQFGETKYGLGRTTRVILDLLTVNYMLRFFDSPMKLFGRAGLYCSAFAVLSGLTTIGMKLIGGVDMTGNPLLLQTTMLILVGIQFFSLGLLGEVNARIYYRRDEKCNYAVRRVVRQGDTPELTVRKAA